MNRKKQAEVRRVLQLLTESYRATIELMERTFALLRDELALDPDTYWQRHLERQRPKSPGDLYVDVATFTVRFRGKVCFLGNTLAFKLLTRLAKHPNTLVSRDDLLKDVWQGIRSNSAVKSVVSELRRTLRKHGLRELAAALDGSVREHYTLRLRTK